MEETAVELDLAVTPARPGRHRFGRNAHTVVGREVNHDAREIRAVDRQIKIPDLRLARRALGLDEQRGLFHVPALGGKHEIGELVLDTAVADPQAGAVGVADMQVVHGRKLQIAQLDAERAVVPGEPEMINRDVADQLVLADLGFRAEPGLNQRPGVAFGGHDRHAAGRGHPAMRLPDVQRCVEGEGTVRGIEDQRAGQVVPLNHRIISVLDGRRVRGEVGHAKMATSRSGGNHCASRDGGRVIRWVRVSCHIRRS